MTCLLTLSTKVFRVTYNVLVLLYMIFELRPNLVVGIEPYTNFRAGLLVHVHCHVLS
jgi:hypothetical protein